MLIGTTLVAMICERPSQPKKLRVRNCEGLTELRSFIVSRSPLLLNLSGENANDVSFFRVRYSYKTLVSAATRAQPFDL
jgi:hypothetical protein